MGMPEWAAEANRLLDAWADGQAEINWLHEVAADHRRKLDAANERTREARAAFDRFMHGCMTVRADADVQNLTANQLVARTCDCTCGTKCPQGKAGSATRCTILVREVVEPL